MERKRHIRKSSGTTCHLGTSDRKPFVTKTRFMEQGLLRQKLLGFCHITRLGNNLPLTGASGVETLAISASAQTAKSLCDVLVPLLPIPQNAPKPRKLHRRIFNLFPEKPCPLRVGNPITRAITDKAHGGLHNHYYREEP